MWSDFHCQKLNTRRELDHAQNQAERENQAGLVPGPDPDPEENFEIFFELCPFSTWKDSLLRRHISEKRGVSLLTLTVQHPV